MSSLVKAIDVIGQSEAVSSDIVIGIDKKAFDRYADVKHGSDYYDRGDACLSVLLGFGEKSPTQEATPAQVKILEKLDQSFDGFTITISETGKLSVTL